LALLNEHIDGKYEILGKLREGGMGAIYKVRHRLLDEIRVVKVIRSQADTPGEAADRFLHEAKAAIRLRHPNVAVLHDFAVTDDGQAFIVMEYIDGWNLLEVLNNYGPPPVALTLEIARQSLKALGYLHRHRLVHRDVSPDNLMLTRDIDGNPQIKLIDLGIAKALEGQGGLTTTGIFLGKPRYGSPERFGGGAWDARSDLYSFGVVLYELLTGSCPITGSEPAALMAGHLFRPPIDFAETDPRGRVPAELRSVVLRALAKKPEERMASAEDFLWELTLLQDGFPLTAKDMEGVWRVLLPLAPGSAPAPELPGSTQHRLNQEFMLGKTPPTGLLTGQSTLRTTMDDSLAEVVPFPAGNPRSLAAAPEPELPHRIGEGLDLDATWASRPLRIEPRPLAAPPKPAPAAATPAPLQRAIPLQKAAPFQRAAVARPSRAWIAWTAAGLMALVLAAVVGWLWLQRGSPAASAAVQPSAPAPAPALPTTEIAGSATVSAPSAAKPTAAVRTTPPPVPATAEARSNRRSGERRNRSREPAPAPAPLEPMQTGALIQPHQPGVEPPEILQFPGFSYPDAARGSGKKVSVEVAVLVNETGEVISAQVRSGEGSDPLFDQAALEAARRARFHPPQRDGIAGKMWTELRFDFAE
jgi:eukaryotic-like serine/threonine-protein kinase